MKARLVPLYLDPGRDSEFDKQLAALRALLSDDAEFLAPVALGQTLSEADAVVFPQVLGQAYRQVAAFQAIRLPILLITSEFGTLSMWDWEIAEYLRSQGVETIGPYSLAQTRVVCRALCARRELQSARFLVYQDDPGEGHQASIFKRFYWWEDECTQRLREKFGVTIVKKSFHELGAAAQAISDEEAAREWERWQLPTADLTPRAVSSAVKIYLAVRRDLDADPAILSAGINCLNESHFSDTTPCLAWNMLYQERRLIWGCEADTMSMVTEYILHRALEAPIMMTNLYPFVLGNAALKHERIARFPEVDGEADNHILVAHCGYMGVIPQAFASSWTLRRKVLAIVDDNASAIDAELPKGQITLAKLHPGMDKMTVAEGELTGYAHFPDSHCLNGGVIRIRDGHKFMQSLASHHYLLLVGHHRVATRLVGKVFGLGIEEL